MIISDAILIYKEIGNNRWSDLLYPGNMMALDSFWGKKINTRVIKLSSKLNFRYRFYYSGKKTQIRNIYYDTK